MIMGGAGLIAGMSLALAQSGPVNYDYRGVDGGCCSDNNGHDGSAGQRDFIQTDQNLNIHSTANGNAGVFVDVSGGHGGDGADPPSLNHWGGNGGSGRNIDYTVENSAIASAGVGINMYSNGGAGGHWGNAGGSNGGYGIGGSAGNLARITLNNTTVSGSGFGIAVQSWGGYGQDSALAGGFGGERDAGSGGNGGVATVNLRGSTTITVTGPGPGDVNAGVGLISRGGNGGKGELIGGFGGHVNAGSGGNANAVNFTSEAPSKIVTNGDDIYGVIARSIGGDAATNNGSNSRAKAGGNAGAITIDNAGTITTSGNRAIGIMALSKGGQGGNGGDGTWGAGHRGAPDGTPGAINITNSGIILTGRNDTVGAYGILAQALGGQGGLGGDGGGFGSGGPGGGAPAITITNSGTVKTAGNDAAGIVAHSIGGGGGWGGTTNGLFYTIGGNGGGGGNGGNSTLKNYSMIYTSGDHSPGAILQSIGGGGGIGGDSTTTGIISAIAIGGRGGVAGSAGNILKAISSGRITTTGASSAGILLQSIGGGGGHAGSANAVGVGIGLNATVATGGDGGGGGNGGVVQFTQRFNGIITTAGPLSTGILAQSIGGGGGNGGLADTRAITIAPPTGDNPSGTVSIAVTHGGGGGVGGNANTPDIANAGHIVTSGAMSNGITAQSIGGGGGNGGGVLAPMKIPTVGKSDLKVGVTVRMGGNGGAGGEGSWVRVTNSQIGKITTTDTGSVGILAQSIGGGGGSGGNIQQHDANSFNDIVGSPTSFASAAAKVASWIATAPSEIPDFPTWNKKLNATMAVTNGSNGGLGGSGDHFILRNDGVITTTGAHAYGILAQSIGNGGGNAGTIDSSNVSSLLSSIDELAKAIASGVSNLPTFGIPTLNPTLQNGGNGGTGGNGGGTDKAPSIVTNTGTIKTTGDGSAGIVAQSVGGGGGLSTVHAQDLEDTLKKAGVINVDAIIQDVAKFLDFIGTKGASAGTEALHFTNGGQNGSAGSGGVVVVDASDSHSIIETQGAHAPAILAQSVGFGGGVTGAIHTPTVPVETTASFTLGGKGLLLIPSLSYAAHGGSVTVSNNGALNTYGINSAGIVAQSVGGGGGVSTAQMLGIGNATRHKSSLSFALGGSLGLANNVLGLTPSANGGNVIITDNGDIRTQGVFSHGILAQSVGGGGGIAAVSANSNVTSLTASLGSSVQDNSPINNLTVDGGDVSVTASGITQTTGDLAFGVLAQSIGGGGGLIQVDNGVSAIAAPINITFGANGMTGKGGRVTVTEGIGWAVSTAGTNAHAIVAQSVGGGGGIAGLGTQPNLVTLHAVGSPPEAGSDINNGGIVNLSTNGSVIITQGNGAIGILAQSIGGGGGLAGDQSSTRYGLDLINSTSLVSGPGNGGAVTINAGGHIKTTGANAPAIMAMSIGGGGVFKDGRLYQYQTVNNTPAYGGAVTVNVKEKSRVEASGEDSPAIIAFSNGSHGSSGGVWVNIDKSASVLASMDSGTGILAPAGITVNNNGLIQSKTAISAAQAVVVNNNGIIQGNVVLTGNGVFNNNAGGKLWSGATVQTTRLNNAGTLNPGGPGQFLETRIAGSLNQQTGIYAPDLDFAAHKSDFIRVTDTVTFGGMISPLVRNPVKDVWLGIAHFDQAPAVAATPKLASTPLFSLNMKDRYGGKQDPSISVDFKPFTFATNQDQGNVIGHLQELWDMADSRSGSLFDPFVGVQSAQQYQQTLGAIAHDGQFARAANQVHETFASMNRLMSCPMFVGEGVLLRESDCVWGRVNTNWVQRRMTYSDNDYHIRQTALQVGAQKEIMRDWFAAASFSYGFGDMSSSRVTGTNDTFSGGIALKHTIGPWQFATAIHGGFETSDVERYTLGGIATSRPKSSFIAARLRAAYEVEMHEWYLRPYVDLDINHIKLSGYREYGADIFDLRVFGHSNTSIMVTPSLEIGGRTNFGDTTLRSYLTLGASFLSGGAVTTQMKLDKFNLAPFALTTGASSVYGNFSAGLEWITDEGFALRGEYGLRVGDHYLDQSAVLRAAYHF